MLKHATGEGGDHVRNRAPDGREDVQGQQGATAIRNGMARVTPTRPATLISFLHVLTPLATKAAARNRSGTAPAWARVMRSNIRTDANSERLHRGEAHAPVPHGKNEPRAHVTYDFPHDDPGHREKKTGCVEADRPVGRIVVARMPLHATDWMPFSCDGRSSAWTPSDMISDRGARRACASGRQCAQRCRAIAAGHPRAALDARRCERGLDK